MNKKKFQIKIAQVLNKKVQVSFLLVIVLHSIVVVGVVEYYVLQKRYNQFLEQLAQTTQSPEELVQILKQEVLPQEGYKLGVAWHDIGQRLLEEGAIDQAKYEQLFKDDPQTQSLMKYLTHSSDEQMRIDENNSRFIVNTLWAIGLVNNSKILDEGLMKKSGEGNAMSYASTGGWDLGAKPTSELYSSVDLITLTPEQEQLVEGIAENIYRPCCGNHTAFPDCNHGMAALGYIQLGIHQGLSQERIYRDLLALNSFWFPQNYIEIAYYMNRQGIKWDEVSAQEVLSAEFASIEGAQRVRQSLQNVPGLQIQGGGCSA